MAKSKYKRRDTGEGGVQPLGPVVPPISRKASTAEKRQRVEMVMKLIVEGRAKSYIKRFCRQFFNIGAVQTERYIRFAREELAKMTQLDRQALIDQSYGFYMSILSDPSASAKDKILARKMADELLGLAAAKKIAPTTPEGKGLFDRQQALVEAARKMTPEERAAVRRMQELATGQSVGRN